MRAIEAKTFSGYGGLWQIELPKPQPVKDRVLVRVNAAGVTPLDHTILSGGHPRAKAPLVLGNEGAGVIEDAADSGLAAGSRVMFTGPYGVRENGAWQEWVLARPEDLALVPDAIDNVVAASTHFYRSVIRASNEFESQMSHLFASLPARIGDSGY
jgi:NADPH2:quinone reductase